MFTGESENSFNVGGLAFAGSLFGKQPEIKQPDADVTTWPDITSQNSPADG